MTTSSSEALPLPPADSPNLILTNPTPSECQTVWKDSYTKWGTSFALDDYIKGMSHLLTLPQARSGGATMWVLVDGTLPPDDRPILSSSCTLRKRALKGNPAGTIEEVAVYGICQVFCPERYRGRGYGKRHMVELGKVLSPSASWHDTAVKGIEGHEGRTCVGSILYSAIGREFYGRLGWTPHPGNWHVEFPPSATAAASIETSQITEKDVPALCKRDESLIRKDLERRGESDWKEKKDDDDRDWISLLPDEEQIGWQLGYGDMLLGMVAGQTAQVRGAIAGDAASGRQAWALWSHKVSGDPTKDPSALKLIIMRFVVEGDPGANRPVIASSSSKLDDEQAGNVLAVLRAAQREAAEWGCGQVVMWEPSPGVKQIMEKVMMKEEGGMTVVQRETNFIASGMWYGDEGRPTAWVNNEYFSNL